MDMHLMKIGNVVIESLMAEGDFEYYEVVFFFSKFNYFLILFYNNFFYENKSNGTNRKE